MDFRKSSFGAQRHEPEINLIPFIDVLLVVLIFLMLITTYQHYTELQVVLPAADTEAARQRPRELIVAVSADNRYSVDRHELADQGLETLAQAMRAAAGPAESSEAPVLVISADENSSHQAVIRVMDAARRSGLERIVFATRKPQES